MAQETITIKFVPDGDKRLVSAINALRDAQMKLVGENVKVKKTFSDLNPKMLQVHAALKKQKKSWEALGISVRTGTQAIKGNKKAIDLVNARMRALGITQEQLNKGTLFGVRNNRLLANSFATLRSQLLLVSFGAMLIERAFVSLVKSYGVQEAANEKLRVGLGNVRDTTEGVTQRLVDYSAALQQTTAFGDEMITTGMVQFTTFGLNEKAIKSLTPQVLNVARAIQTVSGTMPDLNSLFIAFGKATTTGIGTLTRYGVVLTETERAQLSSMNANESAVKIAEILERQYGGLAEAYRKTTAGMLEAAAAAKSDLAESFGEVLAPAVIGVSKVLVTMFKLMSPARIARVTAAVVSFGIAFGTAKVAVLLYSGAMRKAAIATMGFTKALAKNPIALIAVAISVATVALGEYFGLFDFGNKTLTDAEKKQLELIESTTKLAEAQEEGAEKLQQQLELLNATNEVEKMRIQLGHEASDVELKLINNIVAKTQAMKLEETLKRNDIAIRKESLDLEDRILLLTMEGNNAKAKDLALTQEQLRFNKEVAELRGADEDEIIFWTEAQLEKLGLLKEEHRLIMELIKANDKSAELKKKTVSDGLKGSAQLIAMRHKDAKALAAIQAAAALIDAYAAAQSQYAMVSATLPFPFPQIAYAAALATGIAQAQQVTTAAGVFEQGGLIGGRRHSQGGTMIEAEQGEFVMSRSAVESVGIENLNRMNEGGGGGAITVNISGNLLSQDYVEGELAEGIKEAVRRGTDFGIS